MVPAALDACFALLDDCRATPDRPASRLYRGFEGEHRCIDPRQLDAVFAAVEADQRAGLHAVLLIDYEWGAKLMGSGHEHLAGRAIGPGAEGSGAALRVLMFRERARLSEADADAWLAARDAGQPAGAMNLEPSVERTAFTQAIERILEAIAAGETYQVNYTYRLHGQAYGSPMALYRRLRARQPVGYGALIALPADAAAADAVTHVLSCSPELFLRHQDGVLTARPMKGTASRVTGAEGDSETARHLSIDTKNRAENLMIVDLLRNDLGRIARTGSVKVPELFSIEPYSTVFQMTSTVQAELRPEISFADMLRATFPCGSITGAPKHHTMQLIAGLESTPRGLYCGAIGWLDAAPHDALPHDASPAAPAHDVPSRCGDFCLSVAIRTLTLGREERGLRALRLGVGAGIVADSRAADEFEECRLKARFLTGLDPGFELFETMLAVAASAATSRAKPSVRYLDRHLDRLGRSALALGFEFDRDAARERVVALAASLAADGPWRLRLGLAHGGELSLRHAPLPALRDEVVTLLVAPQRLSDVNPLAAHKTTLRAAYDLGVAEAERAGAFDSLFFTVDGRLVEGGRSSVFVRIDHGWATPPVSDGALPGVMRARLLEDPAWAATERSLTRSDLQRAKAIVVCNALRGVLPARLLHGLPVSA